jgi:hypothetical protein
MGLTEDNNPAGARALGTEALGAEAIYGRLRRRRYVRDRDFGKDVPAYGRGNLYCCAGGGAKRP